MSTRNPTGMREARQIYRDWRHGEHTQAIARRYNRSDRSVCEIVTRIQYGEKMLSPRRQAMFDKMAYPAIARWMSENGKTVCGLARECGIVEASMRSYLGIRKERQSRETIPKFVIDAILRVTGMRYEHAFATREVEE